MATHDGWLRMIWDGMVAWCWTDRTHRILIYIAIVVTLTLVVEIFNVNVVGR